MYRLLAYVFCVFSFLNTFSQESIRHQYPENLYFKGVKLHHEKAFKASSEYLNQYLKATGQKNYLTEAGFYKAINQVETGDKGGEENMEAFAKANPNHPLSSIAYFELGLYSFEKKDYSKVITYFEKVSEDQLDIASSVEFLFKRGYSSMIQEDNEQALRDFKQVIFYEDKYVQPSVYYSGLIHTNHDRYDEALDILLEADDTDGAYSALISELIANIYFQTKKYNELIAYAASKLTDSPTQTNRTLHRLLGETYFSKKEYRAAATHLQRHLDFSRKKMDSDGYYKLGYSYFKIGNDQGAIDNFKLAALDSDQLGQNSSFYLGKLYLKRRNYSYALSAFKTAAAEGEDEAIREEALFLVGKVNYSSGQYSDAIQYLGQFNEAYPTSRFGTESAELLTKSYLKTSDYDQAVSHIEKSSVKTPVIKEAYQTICFQRAQQLFNDSQFAQAIDYFNRSLVYKVKPRLASEAYYYLGESYSITNKPDMARKAYNDCQRISTSTPWYTLSSYGLAYLDYNQKSFSNAEVHFSNYISRAKKTDQYYQDAQVRLADCYFVQKKYDKALSLYKQLQDSQIPFDYLQYQIGNIHSLNDRREAARDAYLKVINIDAKSGYKDNSVYQIGESYIADGAFDNASRQFTNLIQQYPESALVPYSYAKRALSYYNLNQNEKAKNDYEYILQHYISHEVANAALLGLQELIGRGVNVDGFESYMEAFQEANPDNSSLEVVAFEAAKNQYYNQNYRKAIDDFGAFKTKYPESSFLLDVQYFVADSYYRLGDWAAAESEFAYLISDENKSYRTRSLDKRGKSLLALAQYDRALKNYHLLFGLASNRKEQFIAREGLMNSHFGAGAGDSTLWYADIILKEDWKPVGVEEAVWLIKGKSFLNKKEYAQAMDEFVKVINGPTDIRGAEAKYYLALTFHEQGVYKRSLETLFDLNRNYGSYDFWIGKSFLLIADNYVMLDELLQARATLQSIIDNSPDPAVIAQAKQKLDNLAEVEKSVLVQDSVLVDTLSETK